MNLKIRHLRAFLKTIILSLFLIIIFCSSCSEKKIILENKYFLYEIDNLGNNIHFTDKTTGTDYLANEKNSYCASVVKGGKEYSITGISLSGSTLRLDFKDAEATAKIKVRKGKDRIKFTVSEFKGEV
mgnify:CR=1 FL=1